MGSIDNARLGLTLHTSPRMGHQYFFLTQLVLLLSLPGCFECLTCYSCGLDSAEARRCDNFIPVAEWSVKCPPTSSACVSTRGVFQVRMIMSPVIIGNNVRCQDLEVVTR